MDSRPPVPPRQNPGSATPQPSEPCFLPQNVAALIRPEVANSTHYTTWHVDATHDGPGERFARHVPRCEPGGDPVSQPAAAAIQSGCEGRGAPPERDPAGGPEPGAQGPGAESAACGQNRGGRKRPPIGCGATTEGAGR